MAGVEDVEAAIGHDEALAAGTGLTHRGLQFVLGDRTEAVLLGLMERVAQFRHGRGGGTELADHDPGRRIGQPDGLPRVRTGGECQGQGGHHGVAGAGHVIDLPRPGRQVQRRLSGPQERHPLLAAGDEQPLQPDLLAQPFAPFHECLIAGAASRHGLELGAVGGDEGRAPVA